MRSCQIINQIRIERIGKTGIGNGNAYPIASQKICRLNRSGKPGAKRENSKAAALPLDTPNADSQYFSSVGNGAANPLTTRIP